MSENDLPEEFRIPELICILNSWKKRCIDARNGHYERAEALFDRTNLLGYLLIYSTVFSTAFSLIDLKSEIFIETQIIAALIGAFSAVISGVVTQARYGERAEIHRSTAIKYANLVRIIEKFQIQINVEFIDTIEMKKQLCQIIKEWSELAENSPLTPHCDSKSKKRIHFTIAVLFALLFILVAKFQ